MPITTIHVAAVLDHQVKGKTFGTWLTKYDVCAVMADGDRFAPIYETFDPLKASLALRAKQLRHPITVGWRETRYGGRDIVTVDLNASAA